MCGGVLDQCTTHHFGLHTRHLVRPVRDPINRCGIGFSEQLIWSGIAARETCTTYVMRINVHRFALPYYGDEKGSVTHATFAKSRVYYLTTFRFRPGLRFHVTQLYITYFRCSCLGYTYTLETVWCRRPDHSLLSIFHFSSVNAVSLYVLYIVVLLASLGLGKNLWHGLLSMNIGNKFPMHCCFYYA